jgi:hypothetical protein
MIGLDALIVVCHSEKEVAAATFKGSVGYHPMLAFCVIGVATVLVGLALGAEAIGGAVLFRQSLVVLRLAQWIGSDPAVRGAACVGSGPVSLPKGRHL